MKVLLYAVFKVRGLPIGLTPDVRTLKAEQCSPDERSMRNDRLAGDPRNEGRATEAEKLRARRSSSAP